MFTCLCVFLSDGRAGKVTVCHQALSKALKTRPPSAAQWPIRGLTGWLPDVDVLYVPLGMLSKPSLFKVCVGACFPNF